MQERIPNNLTSLILNIPDVCVCVPLLFLTNMFLFFFRHAFSRNRSPTILARPRHKLDFGHGKQMSAKDIARVNRLYKCSK